MDIDQLKLILEAAAAAGDGAYSVVIIWFTLQFTKVVFLYGLLGGAAFGAYKLVRSAIYADDYKSRIEGIIGYGLLYDRDREALWSWLERAQKASPFRD